MPWSICIYPKTAKRQLFQYNIMSKTHKTQVTCGQKGSYYHRQHMQTASGGLNESKIYKHEELDNKKE